MHTRSYSVLSSLVLCWTAFSLHGSDTIDGMSTNVFRLPKDKGRANLVEGKDGAAIRFSFEKDCTNMFFMRDLKPTEEWNRADGISFWVKGDGSKSFAAIELIYDQDYSLRYDFAFSIESTDWKKITAAWRDFAPLLPGEKAIPLGVGGNPPSKLSLLGFGKKSYWRECAASSFAIDNISLEKEIPFEAPAPPRGGPLDRLRSKLRAGKPVTIVTLGDSLTDTRHNTNRKSSWTAFLKVSLETKYKSKVTIINPAISGGQLRPHAVLVPLWASQAPEPDLVTALYGFNDWQEGMRGPQFEGSYVDMIQRIRRATGGKADILALTPVPAPNLSAEMSELAHSVRAAAKSARCGLADTWNAFMDTGKEGRDRLFASDHVHLAKPGQELIATTVVSAIEGSKSMPLAKP